MLCRKNKAGTRIPYLTRDYHYTPFAVFCKYPFCTIFCRNFWWKVYGEKFMRVCRSGFCVFCREEFVVVWSKFWFSKTFSALRAKPWYIFLSSVAFCLKYPINTRKNISKKIFKSLDKSFFVWYNITAIKRSYRFHLAAKRAWSILRCLILKGKLGRLCARSLSSAFFCFKYYKA